MTNPLDNLNVMYHVPASELEQPDVWVYKDKTLMKMPYFEIKNKTLYSMDKPYVPNYEESVLLSKVRRG